VKVYTVKDLETFNRDEEGRLICPTGDYTQIKSFGERCRFGEDCSFGEGCRFGEDCSFGKNSKFENIADTIVGLILFIVTIVMSFVLLLST
jgi:hypothetical protein